jgi:hypothetical protein
MSLHSESWQIGLAVLTLLFVAVEWGFPVYLMALSSLA